MSKLCGGGKDADCRRDWSNGLPERAPAGLPCIKLAMLGARDRLPAADAWAAGGRVADTLDGFKI